MSIRNTLGQGVAVAPARHTNPYSIPTQRMFPKPWVRNPSWPALPTVSNTSNRIVGLYAVYSTGYNSCSLTTTTNSSGTWTVDWGDGTSSGALSSAAGQIDKEYTYSTLPATNAPATLVASTSTVNRTNHGYTDGMEVRLYDVTTTTSVRSGQLYYVVNATANTFQVSDTLGGSAVSINADGTCALLPYKIVTISITTTTSFATINFNLKSLQTPAFGNSSGANWLDLLVSAPSLTGLNVSGLSQTVQWNLLEQFQFISTNAISTWAYMFTNCKVLASIPILDIGTATALSCLNMFSSCYSLQVLPPVFNTAEVTNMNGMFGGCLSLPSVPQMNTSKVTNMGTMFSLCYSLSTAPWMDTSKVTVTSLMFNGCNSLTTVPLYDLRACVNTAQMFQNCVSLKTIPNFVIGTLGLGVSKLASQMFSGCSSLTYVPPLDMSAISDASNMFSSCSALQTSPWTTLTAPNITTANGMFTGCVSLLQGPGLNMAQCANYSNMFTNCTTMINLLGDVVNAVSSNCSSMFSSCLALEYVRFTGNGTITSTSAMFSGCGALEYALLEGNTGTGNTNYTSMFNNCVALRETSDINCSSNTVGGAIGSSNANWTIGRLIGNKYAHSITFFLATATELTERALKTIGKAAATGTTALTLTNCYGSGNVTPTVTIPSGAKVGTVSSAAGITVGMTVGNNLTGTNYVGAPAWTNISCLTDVTANTLSQNSHGLVDGDKVAITATSTTTGYTTWTIYYVINATTNSFQISTTLGGSALDFGGTAATVAVAAPVYVTAISGTSVTFNRPSNGTGSGGAHSFRRCDSYWALLQGWSITG